MDIIRRKDRIEIANDLIQKAREWVRELGPGEGSQGGRLTVLGLAGVTDVDEVYNTSVARLSVGDNQEEEVMRQVAQDS